MFTLLPDNLSGFAQWKNIDAWIVEVHRDLLMNRMLAKYLLASARLKEVLCASSREFYAQ